MRDSYYWKKNKYHGFMEFENLKQELYDEYMREKSTLSGVIVEKQKYKFDFEYNPFSEELVRRQEKEGKKKVVRSQLNV